MSISNYLRTVDHLRYAGRKHTTRFTALKSGATVCSGAAASPPGALSQRMLVKQGKRTFAVTILSKTDRATSSRIRGNWERLPQTARRARVIRNYR